ncbi:MAG TPA: hypothetical protein VEC17_01555 [Candidatus Binatia bacterium]|nr:hypothetical protein [Candidatus Binatia bacterium]
MSKFDLAIRQWAQAYDQAKQSPPVQPDQEAVTKVMEAERAIRMLGRESDAPQPLREFVVTPFPDFCKCLLNPPGQLHQECQQAISKYSKQEQMLLEYAHTL